MPSYAPYSPYTPYTPSSTSRYTTTPAHPGVPVRRSEQTRPAPPPSVSLCYSQPQPHTQPHTQPQPQPHTQPPPPIYIFDLDDVLMPTTALFNQPGVREWLNSFYRTNQMAHIASGYQRVLHPNPTLIHYLHQLPGQKHVLTNASRAHAYASLQALGLHTYVQSVVDADHGMALKPDAAPYVHLQNTLLAAAHSAQATHSAQHGTVRPRIVFFDDRVENHQVPKQLGWTTVWIYGAVEAAERARYRGVVPAHVDVAFATIEEALRYFVSVGGGG